MKQILTILIQSVVICSYYSVCLGAQPDLIRGGCAYEVIQFGSSNKFIYQTYAISTLVGHGPPTQHSTVVASRRIYDDEFRYSIYVNNSLWSSLRSEPRAAFNLLRTVYVCQQRQDQK